MEKSGLTCLVNTAIHPATYIKLGPHCLSLGVLGALGGLTAFSRVNPPDVRSPKRHMTGQNGDFTRLSAVDDVPVSPHGCCWLGCCGFKAVGDDVLDGFNSSRGVVGIVVEIAAVHVFVAVPNRTENH